jgi:hypothetical protein
MVFGVFAFVLAFGGGFFVIVLGVVLVAIVWMV